jgi:signal transduction histidine kinase
MNAPASLLSHGLLLLPTSDDSGPRPPEATKASDAGAQFGLATLDGLRFVETSAGLQRLLGRDADTLAGRELLAFAAGANDAIRQDLYAALRRSNRWSGVIDFVQPDGTAVALEWRIEGQAGSDKRLAVALDVSERIRGEDAMERKLQIERAATAESVRLSRLKDDFIAVAAHELRHPLAPMHNAAYVLQHHRDNAHAADKACGILERQLRLMTVLVDDLMDISRADRAAIKLDRQWLSLDSAIDAALEVCRPDIAAAGQELRVKHDPQLHVCIDRVRFGQVLVNVLNNASKYTPRGGRIEIVASRSGDWAEVAIIDSGVGMPPQRVAEVFAPFTQLHPGHGRASGLGIGLALARSFMAMHGGSIDAYSAGEGKGSCFSVRLPLGAD